MRLCVILAGLLVGLVLLDVGRVHARLHRREAGQLDQGHEREAGIFDVAKGLIAKHAPALGGLISKATGGRMFKPKPKINPFNGDQYVKQLPPYKPVKAPPPNTWDIPEFPSRFVTFFVWNKGTEKERKGRMIYDYVTRKMRIDYFYNHPRFPNMFTGYMFNYEWPRADLSRYSMHGPEGATCVQFTMEQEYERMFSPRSFRRMAVDDIEFPLSSFYEVDRLQAKVAYTGHWNGSAASVFQYRNGTFDKIVIDGDKYEFFDMKDLGSLDNIGALHDSNLRLLEVPEVECNYAGVLRYGNALQLQSEIPFFIKKPYLGKPKNKKKKPTKGSAGSNKPKGLGSALGKVAGLV